MKTSIRFLPVVPALLLLVAPAALAKGKNTMLTGGARYHVHHSEFDALPFDDGDISYTLGYEYHEQNMYWQLMAGYCPRATGTSNDVDFVITPQINLIAKDGPWEGGMGLVGSVIRDDNDDNDDWTGLYGQIILGVHLPIFGIPTSIHAYYPFKRFNKIKEFDFKDVEFGAMIKFAF